MMIIYTTAPMVYRHKKSRCSVTMITLRKSIRNDSASFDWFFSVQDFRHRDSKEIYIYIIYLYLPTCIHIYYNVFSHSHRGLINESSPVCKNNCACR